MDFNDVIWRKASHSGDNGGACVEVGVWRRATRSGANGGECVEVAVWRKATHSGDGSGDGSGCVEVAATPPALIAVRDSKNPSGPKLAFTGSAWRTFIARTNSGCLPGSLTSLAAQ
jgi:Domain of unknown function (DUF397)